MIFLFPVCLLVVSAPLAASEAFLKAASETDMSDMLSFLLSAEDGAADLTSVVRDQHSKDSHAKNQAALESMFKSLPKNEKGNLDLPAARYALHRLFEQRHRWFVRGLHPNAATKGKNSSHLVGQALETIAADNGKGLSLAGLAAIAGTLEQLINKEASLQLDSFWKETGSSVEDVEAYKRSHTFLPGETLAQTIESYMIIYISGADFRKNKQKDIDDDDHFMDEMTREWTETKEWVHSTMLEAVKTEGGCKGELSECRFKFEESAQVLRAVVEKYGFFNDRQCHQVKGKLLELQERDRSGRVTLAEFYKAGLAGAWEFNEKADYLRSLGALDETDEDRPKVIVPNYVSSWVNCLSPSKYYSVCCRNECEDYMKVMEKHFSSAEADPDEIIRLVETDVAFRPEIPPNLRTLQQRLASVADKNDGKVPIHGRLFAQWMHHAFPSACPYPHEAGTTDPQTPDEWMTTTGQTEIKASANEVHQVLHNSDALKTQTKSITVGDEGAAQVDPSQAGAELPWTDVEELLVVRPTLPPKPKGSLIERIIGFFEYVLVIALVCVVIWMASEQRKGRMSRNKGHYF